jgi:hypothetical protein
MGVNNASTLTRQQAWLLGGLKLEFAVLRRDHGGQGQSCTPSCSRSKPAHVALASNTQHTCKAVCIVLFQESLEVQNCRVQHQICRANHSCLHVHLPP